MLAIILDIFGAFLVAKHIKKIWVQIVLAIIVGAVSVIASNMLMYVLFSGTFTPGETMVRIIGGIVWHPLITLFALWFFRKKLQKQNEPVAIP